MKRDIPVIDEEPAGYETMNEPPVFPKVFHRARQNLKETAPGSNSRKREDIFSKSRDTREDRGRRQAKTSQNSQTLPHGR